MKIRFYRLLSILCAVIMMTGAVSVWAAAENLPATPTDLTPAKEEPAEPEQPAAPEQPTAEPEEEAVASVEIVITKTLTINQSWEGKMGRKKPAVLKLDLNRAGTVYMVIEGRDVWASVEKADSMTENPPRSQSDSETGILVYSWEAEAGSYLITLGPVEPNLLARATVTFMDTKAYQAWEEEQKQKEPEPEEAPESEPVPEEEPEENGPESEIKPERHVHVDITWDVPDPVIGDTAHFKATLSGYEGLRYTMQWQYSPDDNTWYDLPGETGPTMDVVINEENNIVYWRILVYVEKDPEE